MSNGDEKKSKNNNLILLKSLRDESQKEIILSEDEEVVKKKLLLIEEKLDSMEKIILSINNENPDTIFDSSTFTLLVGSIAITAAIGVVAEYFGIDPEDIKNLLE